MNPDMDADYYVNCLVSTPVPSKNGFLRELRQNIGHMVAVSALGMLKHAANRGYIEFTKTKLLIFFLMFRTNELLNTHLATIFGDVDLRELDLTSLRLYAGVPRDSLDRHLFYMCDLSDCLESASLDTKRLILRLCRNKEGLLDVTFADRFVDHFDLTDTPLEELPQLTSIGQAVIDHQSALLRNTAASSRASVSSHTKPRPRGKSGNRNCKPK